MKVYLAMPRFDQALTEKSSVVAMTSTNDWNGFDNRFLAGIVVRISSNDKIFSTGALVGVPRSVTGLVSLTGARTTGNRCS